MRLLLIIFLMIGTSICLNAQVLSGILLNAEGALPEVLVQNIHTGQEVMSDASGKFSINGTAGQLLEFHKMGYQTARVRIGAGNPPFYRIMLEPGVQELDEVEVRNHYQDFKHDSLRYHDLFKKELEFPKMSTLQAIQSPFSAMSKKNRQIWAFQKEYAWFEEQKYVDYNFNEKIVSNLTGLKGDSAQSYIRRYRPSYEMIRGMKEYELYSYIKHTVDIWRKRNQFGSDRSRGGGR